MGGGWVGLWLVGWWLVGWWLVGWLLVAGYGSLVSIPRLSSTCMFDDTLFDIESMFLYLADLGHLEGGWAC